MILSQKKKTAKKSLQRLNLTKRRKNLKAQKTKMKTQMTKKKPRKVVERKAEERGEVSVKKEADLDVDEVGGEEARLMSLA